MTMTASPPTTTTTTTAVSSQFEYEKSVPASTSPSSLKKRLLSTSTSQKSGNRICSDCPAKRPTMACIVGISDNTTTTTTTSDTAVEADAAATAANPNTKLHNPNGARDLVVLVCFDCAQCHQQLFLKSGTTIIKNLELEEWNEYDVESFERSGNKRVNAIFEATLTDNEEKGNSRIKPMSGCHEATRLRYIREKYEERRFYSPAAHFKHVVHDGGTSQTSQDRFSSSTPSPTSKQRKKVEGKRNESLASLNAYMTRTAADNSHMEVESGTTGSPRRKLQQGKQDADATTISTAPSTTTNTGTLYSFASPHTIKSSKTLPTNGLLHQGHASFGSLPLSTTSEDKKPERHSSDKQSQSYIHSSPPTRRSAKLSKSGALHFSLQDLEAAPGKTPIKSKRTLGPGPIKIKVKSSTSSGGDQPASNPLAVPSARVAMYSKSKSNNRGRSSSRRRNADRERSSSKTTSTMSTTIDKKESERTRKARDHRGRSRSSSYVRRSKSPRKRSTSKTMGSPKKSQSDPTTKSPTKHRSHSRSSPGRGSNRSPRSPRRKGISRSKSHVEKLTAESPRRRELSRSKNQKNVAASPIASTRRSLARAQLFGENEIHRNKTRSPSRTRDHERKHRSRSNTTSNRHRSPSNNNPRHRHRSPSNGTKSHRRSSPSQTRSRQRGHRSQSRQRPCRSEAEEEAALMASVSSISMVEDGAERPKHTETLALREVAARRRARSRSRGSRTLHEMRVKERSASRARIREQKQRRQKQEETKELTPKAIRKEDLEINFTKEAQQEDIVPLKDHISTKRRSNELHSTLSKGRHSINGNASLSLESAFNPSVSTNQDEEDDSGFVVLSASAGHKSLNTFDRSPRWNKKQVGRKKPMVENSVAGSGSISEEFAIERKTMISGGGDRFENSKQRMSKTKAAEIDADRANRKSSIFASLGDLDNNEDYDITQNFAAPLPRRRKSDVVPKLSIGQHFSRDVSRRSSKSSGSNGSTAKSSMASSVKDPPAPKRSISDAGSHHYGHNSVADKSCDLSRDGKAFDDGFRVLESTKNEGSSTGKDISLYHKSFNDLGMATRQLRRTPSNTLKNRPSRTRSDMTGNAKQFGKAAFHQSFDGSIVLQDTDTDINFGMDGKDDALTVKTNGEGSTTTFLKPALHQMSRKEAAPRISLTMRKNQQTKLGTEDESSTGGGGMPQRHATTRRVPPRRTISDTHPMIRRPLGTSPQPPRPHPLNKESGDVDDNDDHHVMDPNKATDSRSKSIRLQDFHRSFGDNIDFGM